MCYNVLLSPSLIFAGCVWHTLNYNILGRLRGLIDSVKVQARIISKSTECTVNSKQQGIIYGDNYLSSGGYNMPTLILFVNFNI